MNIRMLFLLIVLQFFVFSNSIGKENKSIKAVNAKSDSTSKIESSFKELKKSVNDNIEITNQLKKANDSLFGVINDVKSNKSKMTDLNYISISIDILLLLVVFFIFYKLNGRLSRQRNEIESLKNSPNISGQKQTNLSNHLNDRDKDHEKIKILESKMIEVLNEISKIKQPVDKKSTKEINQQKTEIDKNVVLLYEASKEFFMGVPYENSFTVNSKSETYLLGKAMYKFLIGNTQSEADFEFISDSETIKYIQNNNLEIVRPACVLENSSSPNTIKVVTVKKGKARFQEDKWVIIEKAKIRFE